MSNEFDFHINNFNGPLDLLLELVRQKQMNIFQIDLFELATSYVKMIEKLKHKSIDLASEYLVMAATLIQIKARMLLDIPSENSKVEQEKNDILKKLTQYYKYKKISLQLRENEAKRNLIFIKTPHNYLPFYKEVDETKLDGKSDPLKMIILLRKMFERTNSIHLKEAIIENFHLSPAQRRLEIIEIFSDKSNVNFDDLFRVPTLNHFSITMLTVLDMSKKEELFLEQEEQFGEIKIKKGVFYE